MLTTRLLLATWLALGCEPGQLQDPAPARPNVLFVSLDDLNDWIGPLGGLGDVPRTPNLDRLAAMGTTFTNAHCAAPACNPSRVALLTGLRPTTSGVYANKSDWRAVLPDVQTLPMAFKRSGYEVIGFGKTFHAGDQDAGAWDRYEAPANPLKYVEHYRAGKIAWASVAEEGVEARMPDHQIARMAAQYLRREHERPFFLSVGLKRPHMPWIVPKRYYDLYDEDQIPLPATIPDDLEDVPAAGLAMIGATGKDHAKVVKQGAWRPVVHAYLASISFADAQLGRMLDALASGPNAENTIVCVWSDHGFHLGEKEHWRKFTLWEESTRIPLLLAVPGVTSGGSRSNRPVDLVHLYPTLADLCGLALSEERRARLDGESLRPLLADPRAPWTQPALTTLGPGDHALRTERWRYIRYADGSEELYDHATDPHEWENLARRPETAALRAQLAALLPTTEAEPAPLVEQKKAGKPPR